MATTTREPVNDWLRPFYDAFFTDPIYDAFYGGSGYANFGYWTQDTRTAAQASDKLVDAIVALLPNTEGDVLDVGCGQGASTQRLCQTFDPAHVTGINIDPGQIAGARKRLPDVRFLEMDAAALTFDDDSFNHLVSVEAAFHFRTRKKFFGEAYRVLKPGGCLAMSDLLMAYGAPMAPRENHVSGARAYARLLENAGFKDVAVKDVTQQTWRSYRRRFTEFVARDMGAALSMTGLRDLYTLNVNSSWAIRACYLVSARK